MVCHKDDQVVSCSQPLLAGSVGVSMCAVGYFSRSRTAVIATCNANGTWGSEVLSCLPVDACQPSPCGPNSNCTQAQGVAVCTCRPLFIGTPPSCRAECSGDSECTLEQTCVLQRCVNPCSGACGQYASCKPVNHIAVCSCPPGYTGDARAGCTRLLEDHCQPTPCGDNSNCAQVRGSAVCTCRPSSFGTPPYCRAACTNDSECNLDQVCTRGACVSPCSGTCVPNAICTVVDRKASFSCLAGYAGHPFSGCIPVPPGYQLLAGLQNAYKFYIQAATWPAAKRECKDEGAHLVIINSEAESAAVVALNRKNRENIVGSQYTDVSWVGVSESLTENGQYVTVLEQRFQDTGFNRWTSYFYNFSSLGDVLFIDSGDGGLSDWPAANNRKHAFTCETGS